MQGAFQASHDRVGGGGRYEQDLCPVSLGQDGQGPRWLSAREVCWSVCGGMRLMQLHSREATTKSPGSSAHGAELWCLDSRTLRGVYLGLSLECLHPIGLGRLDNSSPVL